MATGHIGTDEGTTKFVATNTFSEDAITKQLQRLVLNKSDGTEIDVNTLLAALGVTTGAKVITDANGTIQQYLRGLIYLFITAGQALVTADTELPAAAALADGASNPTAPMVGGTMLGFNGATWDRVRVPNVSKDQSTVAIGSIATVWTPTSGKKFRLMGGTISVSAAASVLFEDNSGGNTVFRTPKLLADTPYNFVVNGGQGFLSAAANNVLKATSSASANLLGTLWGTEE